MAKVDLSIGNSIVNAFAQGRAEQIEREKLAQEKAQREQQLQLEKDRLAEQQRQFGEEQTRIKGQFEAQNKIAQSLHDIAILNAQGEFAKRRTASGELPAGYTQDQTKSRSQQLAPGIAGVIETFNPPEGSGTPGFEALDPASAHEYAKKQAQEISDIKTQAEMQVNEPKIQAEYMKQTLDSIEKQRALENALKISRENNQARLGAASIQAAARLKASGDTELAGKVNMVMQNPAALDKFSAKDRGNILGAMGAEGKQFLLTEQQSQIDLLDKIITDAQSVKNAKIKFGPQTQALSKTSLAPDSYHAGILVENLKQNLAKPELARFKGTTSDKELDAAIRSATTLDLGDPKSQSVIDDIIKGATATKTRLEKMRGPEPSTDKVRIKVDLQGNEIK